MIIQPEVFVVIQKGIFSLLAILFAYIIKKFIADRAIYSFAKHSHPEDYSNLAVPVSQFFAAIIYGFLFFVLLYIWEIGGTLYSLIAGAGLAGIILGFAAQDVLKNIIAGVVLFFDKPFKIGDMIQVGQVMGEVRHMGLRSTKVKTLDGVYVNIPNHKMNDDYIYNYQRYDKRRMSLIIGVDYSTDLDKAEKAILKAMNRLQKKGLIMQDEVIVFADDFGQSAINIKVLYWINTVSQSIFKVRGEIIKEIYKEFKKQKIIIPFPQIVISKRKN